MNDFGSIHFSHVKRIAIRIIISDHKIDWLQRIEAKTHRFVGKGDFLDGSFSSKVIENQGTIRTGSTENIGIRRVVFHLQYTINIPLQLINGF